VVESVYCAVRTEFLYKADNTSSIACVIPEKTNTIFLKPYLLTPWSRVLLENLTVNFAASQEIPRIYGTRKFLIVLTSARHMSFKASLEKHNVHIDIQLSEHIEHYHKKYTFPKRML
jgi:hypothetical protein